MKNKNFWLEKELSWEILSNIQKNIGNLKSNKIIET